MGGWGGWCDYGADFWDSVGVESWDRGIGRCSAPPPAAPAAAPTGGVSRWPLAAGRWPLAAGSSPALAWPLERRAVDNFPHLRVLWIARKSLIPFITYARLTKIITHDIHYVKS